MSSVAVLGCLWGDEAKAKIVDVLGKSADIVVRFQGGSNAGHTIYLQDRKFVFHGVPSGILYPQTVCVIASGVVVDVFSLLQEMDALAAQGISFQNRIYIDWRVPLVLPLHKELDSDNEQKLGKSKLGTTGRGIGPAYADDRSRVNLRLMDLSYPQLLTERLQALYAFHDRRISQAELDGMTTDLQAAWKRLAPCAAQTDYYLRESYAAGKRILFEGAQGTLLDITYGTYPYVTSSNTIAGGIATGCGIPLKMVDKVIGVYKAYCTRVGEGPFPTELTDATGDYIRNQGREFGATTGRPRRCGWFDAVAARYTAEINGLDSLVITLLDVLSGLPEVKICTAYWIDGVRHERYPSDPVMLGLARPEYLTLKGWQQDISGCRSVSKLPKAAREYVEAITELLAVPLEIISVGKERSQTIFLTHH